MTCSNTTSAPDAAAEAFDAACREIVAEMDPGALALLEASINDLRGPALDQAVAELLTELATSPAPPETTS